MSCLAPAPLSDLVTKEHLERVLSSAFSEFALNQSDWREADRKQIADEREADRQEARKRHRWLVGIAVVLALEIVAAEAGWLQPLTDLLTAAS